MSTVLAGAASHVGQVREHNEDSYLVDPRGRFFAIADGMGGHAAGEVASRLAVDTVATGWASSVVTRCIEAYRANGDADSRRALLGAVRDSVMEAHARIVRRGASEHAEEGMGTTFTGLVLAGGDAIFAHAGDSRAYLVRDEIPSQLSEDHSVASRLRAAGIAGHERGDVGRWQGVLTNALGVADARVATFVVPIYSGDRFVLSSDGMHDYFEEAEIGAVVSAAASPGRAAQRLVELAVERGGEDNATAVVVKVIEAGETRVPPELRARDDAALARCRLLSGLDDRERLRALRIATTREHDEGEVLAPVALEDRVAYLVLSGEVEEGGVRRGAGSVVYAESLIEGGVVSRRATVAGPVRVLVVRGGDFAELCDDEPELGVKLYEALADLLAR